MNKLLVILLMFVTTTISAQRSTNCSYRNQNPIVKKSTHKKVGITFVQPRCWGHWAYRRKK